MRKYFTYSILCLLLMLSAVSCKQEEALVPGPDLYGEEDKEALDHFILQQIKDTDQPFDWNTTSNEMMFKALSLTNNIMVVGYSEGINTDLSIRDAILSQIYQWKGVQADRLGELDEVLIYKDDVLGFMAVKVESLDLVKKIRQMESVVFAEVSEYPIAYELMLEYAGKPVEAGPTQRKGQGPLMRDMILDPYQDDPDYPDQVEDYDDGLGTVIRRHNIDDVYRTYQIYGEDIGLAVIDNGIVDWAADLFFANGYGGRETVGFYNPLWFLPWTQPDGVSPQSSDIFGISELFEGQWLHGSGMIQSAFVVAPNADIVSARASTAIVILSTSQIRGITNAFRAMADRPEIRVTNMSMGTIFHIHQIKNAIVYYHSKGKIIACAAGTTPEEIKDLLGIIFPANLPWTVSVTGINNRENTNGEFIAGSTAHTGPQNDFCVEASAASSEATARMVGMFALLWSANPDLTREEVMEIMITSSYFYHENGQKDPEFGWGTVDMLEAVQQVL